MGIKLENFYVMPGEQWVIFFFSHGCVIWQTSLITYHFHSRDQIEAYEKQSFTCTSQSCDSWRRC